MNFKLIPALVLASALLCSHATTISGHVVGVVDGDTVTVLDTSKTQHKIRLSGIDAPEKKQAFGMRSKQSLSDLVFDKQVTVETDKKEKYRREVGKILLSTGQDVMMALKPNVLLQKLYQFLPILLCPVAWIVSTLN